MLSIGRTPLQNNDGALSRLLPSLQILQSHAKAQISVYQRRYGYEEGPGRSHALLVIAYLSQDHPLCF